MIELQDSENDNHLFNNNSVMIGNIKDIFESIHEAIGYPTEDLSKFIDSSNVGFDTSITVSRRR